MKRQEVEGMGPKVGRLEGKNVEEEGTEREVSILFLESCGKIGSREGGID